MGYAKTTLLKPQLKQPYILLGIIRQSNAAYGTIESYFDNQSII